MGKGRLEAFSDGVLAIITIMVLELKVPHGERTKSSGRFLIRYRAFALRRYPISLCPLVADNGRSVANVFRPCYACSWHRALIT